MLLALPRYVFQHAGYLTVYKDLLTKLPDYTSFILVVHADSRSLLDGILVSLSLVGRVTIVEVPGRIKFSAWVGDICAVVREVASVCLVEPLKLIRVEDVCLCDFVATYAGLERRRANLYFEGGNLLVGEDFWLLGADHADHSIRLGLIQPATGESTLDAIRRSFEILDSKRTLHLVGTKTVVPHQTERSIIKNGAYWTEQFHTGNLRGSTQPIYHLDMFITLAGNDARGNPVVLVGDPRLASQILNEPISSHALTAEFDEIARSLVKQGFHVIRNPLPQIYRDDPLRRERKWYFASSNNALLEITAQGKRVWLPTYGHGLWSSLASIDAANQKLWESLGFQVVPLANCHSLAFNLGGLHCITKIVARGR
ncbi:hypothetical protein K2X85_19065 [bacterium]|nr:hypothetical protein [bacterium]